MGFLTTEKTNGNDPFTQTRPIELDQILLFGDSITQKSFDPVIHGWGAILANEYMRKLDVVNRGYSGISYSCFISVFL